MTLSDDSPANGELVDIDLQESKHTKSQSVVAPFSYTLDLKSVYLLPDMFDFKLVKNYENKVFSKKYTLRQI